MTTVLHFALVAAALVMGVRQTVLVGHVFIVHACKGSVKVRAPWHAHLIATAVLIAAALTW